MRVKHVGIRPRYLTTWSEVNKGWVAEKLPNGITNHWSPRMMQSGCNTYNIEEVVTELNSLVYCEHCDEYFTYNQFIIEGEDDDSISEEE